MFILKISGITNKYILYFNHMVCNRLKRNKKIVVKLILNLMTIISFYITKTHCINSGLHKKEQQTLFLLIYLKV